MDNIENKNNQKEKCVLELIEELCPDEVEYYKLWEVTTWNKKYNNVDKSKQPEVFKIRSMQASEAKKYAIEIPEFEDEKVRNDENLHKVKVLLTSKNSLYVDEDMVKEYLNQDEIIAIPTGGNPNVQYYKGKFITANNTFGKTIDSHKYSTKYIFYFLQNKLYEIADFYRGGAIKHPDMSRILELEIPIPPIEVQKKIVKVLDSMESLTDTLTAELDLRKKQYEYYREELLNNEDFPIYKLNKIGKVCMCKRIMKAQTIEREKLKENTINKVVPFYKIGTFGKEADSYIPKDLYNEYKSKYSYPKKGDILISCSGTIGRTVIFDGEPAYFQDSNIVWIKNDEKIVLNRYLYFLYQLKPFEITQGGTIARLYNSGIENAEVRIPLIEQQERILEILEPLEKLTQSLTEGIPAEIEGRKRQYEYYRELLLSFKRKKQKKIRFELDYGAWPIWLLDENGLVVENKLPKEWKNNKKLETDLDRLQELYESQFVNNEKEFEFIGFESKKRELEYNKLLNELRIFILKNIPNDWEFEDCTL